MFDLPSALVILALLLLLMSLKTSTSMKTFPNGDSHHRH